MLLRILICIRDLLLSFNIDNWDKDFGSEAYRQLLAHWKDEELIELGLIDVFIRLWIYACTCEFDLHDASTRGKPRFTGVPQPLYLANLNDKSVRDSIAPPWVFLYVQILLHRNILSLQLRLELLELVHCLSREGSGLGRTRGHLGRGRSVDLLFPWTAAPLVPWTAVCVRHILLRLNFGTEPLLQLLLLLNVLLYSLQLVLKGCQQLGIAVVKELAVLVFFLHAVEAHLVRIRASALLSHTFYRSAVCTSHYGYSDLELFKIYCVQTVTFFTQKD